MNSWPIRKIYLYLMCAGSMFMFVIGSVILIHGLLSFYFQAGRNASSDDAVFAASLWIVALPIWFIHWRLIKKDNQ